MVLFLLFIVVPEFDCKYIAFLYNCEFINYKLQTLNNLLVSLSNESFFE